MLRLFSRSPRKARPVPLQRARLCVELLEARSGPSALYDPLVIEPVDDQSSLWYSTSDPAASSTTTSDPASAPPAGDTSGGTSSSSGGTTTSTSPLTSTEVGSSGPVSVGIGTDITPLASTGGSGPITEEGPVGGGQGAGSTLPPPPPANQAPKIVDFAGAESPGRVWTFTGRVEDESPGGLIVTFGGLPSLVGKTTVTAPNGDFSTAEVLQAGESGWATAQAVDAQGLASNVARYYVTQTLP